MTITITDAAQAIKYLHAAGTMTAVDDQEVVWADFLNDPEVGVPNALTVDMLPAARLTIKRWAAQEGNFRRNISVADFAQSLDRIQQDRVTEVVGFAQNRAWAGIIPQFTPTYDELGWCPSEGPYWQDVAREIANTNSDRDQVYRLALDQILRDTDETLDAERVQPEWVQEAYGVGIPGMNTPKRAQVGDSIEPIDNTRQIGKTA